MTDTDEWVLLCREDIDEARDYLSNALECMSKPDPMLHSAMRWLDFAQMDIGIAQARISESTGRDVP